jgi:hypothetical protein
MKQHLGLTAIILTIVIAALFAAMSARAGDRRSTFGGDENQPAEAPAAATSVTEPAADSDTDKDSDADKNADADASTEQGTEPAENSSVIIDTEGSTDSDSDKPKAPPPSDKELYDGLVAISPAGGVQLPTPPESDHADWLSVKVGYASMLVPPGWTISNQIGKEGDDDQTIGLSPPSNDIYIELRQIRNSDSNYEQTPLDLAISDYRSTPDRLKQGVTFGYQPMVIDGAVGHVETMNQFGKEKNDDGTPTDRMITWRGRWEQNDAIQKVEFNATFAQGEYEKFAPVVSEILATIKISDAEPTK